MRHGLVEPLEARRLLAGAVGNVFPVEPSGAPASGPLLVASVLPASPQALAGVADHVDAAAVRDGLIRFVDTWNGGQQGRSGTSGMGAYAANWNGLFRTNLDRQFNRYVNTFTDDQTIVSQSRGIYINVEAYRNAPAAADRARFRTAVQKGADYLLAKAVDPKTYNGQPGGMWWGLQPDGVSPPTHTNHIGGTLPRHKDPYGQAQALLALAHAYSVTGDADHLDGAYKELDALKGQFADAAAGPGAFLPTANESYTQRVGNRNVNYILHAFEAFMALDRVTLASDPRKAAAAAQVIAVGDFIATRLYRDDPGSTTSGYLPAYYDAQWNPSTDPRQQYSDPGHDIQVALLLSRAVESGFNPAWLGVADKLLAHTLAFGIDLAPASPTYGAVVDEKLAYDGTRFAFANNHLVWWQSAEVARAMLHFAVVRGRTDLWDEYDAASAFIRNRLVDPVYGGWFTYLDRNTLAPTTTHKGTVWTGGYHEVMLDAERLRLAPPPPPPASVEVATLPAAAGAYVRDGAYASQNFGAAADLVVKRSANLGNTRETDVRFDLAGVGDVVDGMLRLFGRSTTAAQNVPVALYAVANTGWPEAGLTWNNKPPSAAAAIAARTVAGTGGQWYEFDVSSYLRQQKAAGATAVAFTLKAAGVTDAQALFNSDEAAANPPQLLLRHAPAQPQQGLVMSTNNLSVPEGGTAQFTVRLALAPSADLTVTVAKQSGDPDLTGAATLVFTPADWNTPQPVTLAAAPDADATNGTASFAVSSLGLPARTLTATEADDDPPAATPVTITSTAATHVRDGSYAGQNFGASPDLHLRAAATGFNREIWLKFDLSFSSSAIANGKLRLFGRIDSPTERPTVSVYSAANTAWSETGLTWSNRPPRGPSALASQTIATSTAKWYEWDVTPFLQAEKAAGRNVVTLVLRSLTPTTPYLIFNSDEAATARAELVITPG